MFEFDKDFQSLEHCGEMLAAGHLQVKVNENRSLATTLNFGLYLNKAFEYFRQQKRENKHLKIDWQHWIQWNVCLSTAYDKRLRSTAKALEPFPRF